MSRLTSHQTSELIKHLEDTTYLKAELICAYVEHTFGICSDFIQHFNLKKWKEAISSVQTSYPDPFSFNITRAIVKAYRK